MINNTTTHAYKITSIIAAAVALSACGGGSSSPSVQAPPNPVNSIVTLSPTYENASLAVYGSSEIASGSAVGFALTSKTNSQIESVVWTQTSGNELTILAKNSQTIGFDVPQSGSYTLNATVRFVGQAQSESIDVPFSAISGTEKASVRLDHTVSELGKVSLHLGAPANKTVSSVEWEQLAGPLAQSVQTDDEFLFFDAPSVSQDSIIQYQATVTYSDGSTETDDALVTVKNVNFNTSGLFYDGSSAVTEDLYAYQSSSPFKTALERCVYNNTIDNPPDCNFSELPLIGTSTNGQQPSITEILDRTLVSHEWMGRRFEEYLRNSPAGTDMLNLLRGVTAVVISYDVRPSFYWAATGAIYLDANNFWQTPAERDTLNDVPDFRSDFGSDLQFRMFWRYTKNNDYYPSGQYDKQARTNRSFADVEASISWLMYHELAHANDFFPPTSWGNISQSTTPLAYFRSNGTNSDILTNLYPLRSSEMHSLAQVRYRDQAPSDAEKQYTGVDIERFFVPDISPSFYSYLTDREDFATLFERYMMLFRLNSEADIAIIDGETDDDFIVTWGQRNRITEPSLQDRTVFVVNRVYPELLDVREQLTTLPEPINMNVNDGWFGNIAISSGAPANRSKSRAKLQKHERLAQALLDQRSIHDNERNKK